MKFKINNIRMKLLLSYGFLLMIICIIFSILYLVSKHTIQTTTINNSLYTAEIMGEKLNSEIEYLLTIVNQIYNNNSVNKHVNNIRTSADSWTLHYHLSKLNTSMNDLTQILIQDNKRSEVLIFSPVTGLMYYSWTTLNNFSIPNNNISEQIKEDIDILFQKKDQYPMSYQMIRNSYNPNKLNESYFYFYKAHTNPYSKSHDYYIIIGLPKESMEQYLLPSVSDDYNVIYTDSDNRIIYSNLEHPENYLGQLHPKEADTDNYQVVTYQGEKYIQLNTSINAVNWTQIQLLPIKEILRELNHWSYIIVIALVCLSIGLACVCIYLNRNIIYPIKQLDKDIHRVKTGDTNLLIPKIRINDEISRLSFEFYDMVQQLHILQQQMLLKEKQKRDFEIEALQAQINPHFMYNTIGSIKMLLRFGQTKQAISSLSALVDIIKNTIARTDETISLEEELHILKSYIYIQQRRYSEFQFEVTLPEQLKNYHIMRFIIQPFIENSLLHGYEEIDQHTKISVSFSADFSNQILTVTIQDNGCGITSEKLQEILTKSHKNRGLNGIGIKNIMDRIRLNYGDPYSVQFHSVNKQGTTVILTLPLLTEKGAKTVL